MLLRDNKDECNLVKMACKSPARKLHLFQIDKVVATTATTASNFISLQRE
jgi:hypothetical protein